MSGKNVRVNRDDESCPIKMPLPLLLGNSSPPTSGVKNMPDFPQYNGKGTNIPRLSHLCSNKLLRIGVCAHSRTLSSSESTRVDGEEKIISKKRDGPDVYPVLPSRHPACSTRQAVCIPSYRASLSPKPLKSPVHPDEGARHVIRAFVNHLVERRNLAIVKPHHRSFRR